MELKRKNQQGKINKTKSWFFEKNYKISKFLGLSSKERRENTNN